MALIESRSGKPVRSGTLLDIYEALIFATSLVCDPRQHRLCDWGIWIGERKYELKESEKG